MGPLKNMIIVFLHNCNDFRINVFRLSKNVYKNNIYLACPF